MQEKTAPVFVVATANDVTQLPPELLRAGRWDQMFFVDLPNVEEREAIWTIQIRKHGRNPADFDTVQLARASDGLTGSEIEAVFVDSLYDAFDRDTEPTDLDIARVLTDFVPLSKTMAEQINGTAHLGHWSCPVRHLTGSDGAQASEAGGVRS
jgi:SpoVK/Ycf46/Vps4 family AAA+-type ATPase